MLDLYLSSIIANTTSQPSIMKARYIDMKLPIFLEIYNQLISFRQIVGPEISANILKIFDESCLIKTLNHMYSDA